MEISCGLLSRVRFTRMRFFRLSSRSAVRSFDTLWVVSRVDGEAVVTGRMRCLVVWSAYPTATI